MEISIELLQSLMTAANEAGAKQFYANLHPREDEISEKEAIRKYGVAWMKKHAPHLHLRRTGDSVNSKKIYSVAEIERLRKIELIASNN